MRTELTDLAVLGVTMDKPIAGGGIGPIVKSLAPNFWKPTNDVVDKSILRNLGQGYLKNLNSGSRKFILNITPEGRSRFIELLVSNSALSLFNKDDPIDALLLCFLDFADKETARLVLQRMNTRTHAAMHELRSRKKRCPHRGQFTQAWWGLELGRLKLKKRALSRIAARNDIKLMSPSHVTGGNR